MIDKQKRVIDKTEINPEISDVIKSEELPDQTFIAVTFNTGMMPLTNIQEQWSIDVTSCIPFYRDIFIQILWLFHLKTSNAFMQNFVGSIF